MKKTLLLLSLALLLLSLALLHSGAFAQTTVVGNGFTYANGGVVIGTSVLNAAPSATVPQFSLGTNTPSGLLAGFTTHAALSGDSLFYDQFHDENTFATTTTGGYASFDSNVTVTDLGAAPNHIHPFQNRSVYSGSVTLPNYQAFSSKAVINGPVTNLTSFYVYNATGSAALTGQYGLYCDSLTKGTSNYCIWDNNSTPSMFMGGVRVENKAVIGLTALSLANSMPVSWSSTTGYSGAADVGLSRIAAGVVGVGTGANGSVAGRIAVDNATPANAATACTAQSIWADANYVYVCTASGVIKRAALATW